ncbi:MAG: hypothetical protein GX660_25205 [Clostridiaceae bacterium]|nr:hypothetical protein [Clostridiaceae bacterium]
MAQFCTCGSLMINEACTNKNCAFKAANASSGKASGKKSTASKSLKADKPAKSTKVRRASKCITYNLNDIRNEDEESY